MIVRLCGEWIECVCRWCGVLLFGSFCVWVGILFLGCGDGGYVRGGEVYIVCVVG